MEMDQACPDDDLEYDDDPMEEHELLTEIALALVSRTSEVYVDRNETKDTTHLTIHAAPEDVGKLIGKSGETISVLRKLFGRIAATNGKKTYIHIYEPNKVYNSSRQRVVAQWS